MNNIYNIQKCDPKLMGLAMDVRLKMPQSKILYQQINTVSCPPSK
jgi:hypothetical protein